MKLSRQQFKQKWESSDDGGGITFNDIAECAVNWGLCLKPKTQNMNFIRYIVLKEANTNDAELYNKG